MDYMKILEWSVAKKTYPTGNPNFSVMQAFPAGISAEKADPFLMCDFFGPVTSKGKATDPDQFDVPWHPHRGMDILTYLQQGVGRHADSLGNRGEYATPGMQWISVGSGIEHAEGGGTPAGQTTQGFQIWVNVPSQHKMDDPRYGTEGPEKIPTLDFAQSPGVSGRLLAGPCGEKTGPFQTKQAVQVVDFVLQPGAAHVHEVPGGYDTCMVFIYAGAGNVSHTPLPLFSVSLLDTSSPSPSSPSSSLSLPLSCPASATTPLSLLVFSGRKLREPIAWRGPFVLNTAEEVRETMREIERGAFPPKRAPWDYKRISEFPKYKISEFHKEL